MADQPVTPVAPPTAPVDQGKTTLLSPLDQKFYSVPTGQVAAYLKAGYATPIARDVAHERLLKQYSGWADTLTAGALGVLHGVPGFDSLYTGVSSDREAKNYAESSKLYAEANPFASGVGKFAGGVGAVAAASVFPGLLGAEAGGAEGAGAATGALTPAVDVSRLGQAAKFSAEAVKSGVINTAIGAAGQLDEAALNHAIDPEGHEKLNMSMGGLLADFALGAGAHVGLSAVGKIFKGAGHGLDYVADNIRAKGIADTAPLPEGATPMGEGAPQTQLAQGDPTVQTPAGPVDPGVSGPGAVPTLDDLGPKPISAAEQRIQDIKAQQAEDAATAVDPTANPSVRAQKAQNLQAELERLQSLSEDEIVAEHASPSDISEADAAASPDRVNPLHGEQYADEAFNRLEDISHLTRAEQNEHLKGERIPIEKAFRQAEREGETGGRGLNKQKVAKMAREIEDVVGPNNAVLKETLYPYMTQKLGAKELKRLTSEFELDGSKKDPGTLLLDQFIAKQSTENPGAGNLSLRGHRNMKQALSKEIGWTDVKPNAENEKLKEVYKIIQKYEGEHFNKVKPGEITGDQYADLNKRYHVNQLAKRAIGQTQGEEDLYSKILARSKDDHAAAIEKLQAQAKQADTMLAHENERAAKSKARAEDYQNKRLTDAERQKARQDYNEAVKNIKAQQAASKKAAAAVEAEKAKAAKVQKRAQDERARQQVRAETKAVKLKDQQLKQQQINEAKFGHVVHAGILGAITHGMKGSLEGMAASAAFAVLRGIPPAKWAMVGDKLSVLFKGVDKKLATTVEAGLYGIPAEVHRALDPNDYPDLAAKVMAARNGPQNAFRNLAQAHLENDVPDALATPLTQQGWSALQAVGKAIPQTAGAPGVYSHEEPDAGQKLTWMGQLKTVQDPTYGIANPTPENLSLLKAYYPKMLYNSQQAAMLEVQQNPDLPLEGKIWASQLCERPLTSLASSQFLGVLAGARQQSEQSQQQQNSPSAGKRGSQKVQSSMSRMDSLQNQDA